MPEINTHLILSDLFTITQHQDSFSWRVLRPGVEICELYQGAFGNPTAALLRYTPGAEVPTHVHQGAEFILVLSGSQSDENGVYPAGSVIANPPDTSHHVTSSAGCIVLAIWEKPVKFL